jgi:aldehyde dehydrogenase (NAD+)
MTISEIFRTMAYGPAPEAPDAADSWLDAHDRQFDLFIDNTWTAPKSGNYMPAANPATGQTLAQIADANAEDINIAVKAARKAAETWSKTSGHVRARYLYAIARNIQKHQRLLAVLESMDNGKSIRESRDIDIPLVARHFYHHAGWAQLMETEMAGYKPVGVVGQVIPWNFPLLMLAWKIAPALAMGNTVVIKPAPYTSLTALLFAEIIAEAGLPPGVVNITTGGDEAGASITSHPDFDKIAFTGSTEVGRIIRRVTAGTGKKLSLELGGKSPFVIFDDADHDSTIEGLVDAIWFNQGQVCCAGSKMLIQENVAERFLQKLRDRMDKLRVGDSLDKGIDIGAIVAPVQHETISKWVEIGLQEGAEIYQPECELPAGGCFYPPTLLTNVAPSSSVAQEEIFGPVLVAMTFRTPAEAVQLANNTRYGLAASIWTENINLAIDVATKIKAGSVWINATNVFDAASGFGGYRESGFGREGGKEGLYEYVRPSWEKRLYPTLPEELDVKAWSAHTPGHPGLPGNGAASSDAPSNGALPSIDRTPKFYIGGKQKRPDGNYTYPVVAPDGSLVGQAGEGNRKDIRDAVEAAHKAAGWATTTGHLRAQILYYLAENLSARSDEFAARIAAMTGNDAQTAAQEVEASISRLFSYASYADKFGGSVQETPMRGITIGLHEAIGVIGIACPDEQPLLGFVSLVAPAIARGNTVVVLPSETYPLAATDLYQVLDTSDVPSGVVNIVTGKRDHLTKTLAEHDDVAAMWYFGTTEGSYHVEALSAGNMKRTWVNYGHPRDWYNREQSEGEEFLREAVQVKNIWVPAGE